MSARDKLPPQIQERLNQLDEKVDSLRAYLRDRDPDDYQGLEEMTVLQGQIQQEMMNIKTELGRGSAKLSIFKSLAPSTSKDGALVQFSHANKVIGKHGERLEKIRTTRDLSVLEEEQERNVLKQQKRAFEDASKAKEKSEQQKGAMKAVQKRPTKQDEELERERAKQALQEKQFREERARTQPKIERDQKIKHIQELTSKEIERAHAQNIAMKGVISVNKIPERQSEMNRAKEQYEKNKRRIEREVEEASRQSQRRGGVVSRQEPAPSPARSLPSSSKPEQQQPTPNQAYNQAIDFKYTEYTPTWKEQLSTLVPRGIPGTKYVGYGTPLGEHLNDKVAPVSGTDVVSMEHDLAYTMASHTRDPKRRKALEDRADIIFIDKMAQVKKKLKFTNPEYLYANIAEKAMRAKQFTGTHLVDYVGEPMKAKERGQYDRLIYYLTNTPAEDYNSQNFRDNIFTNAFSGLKDKEQSGAKQQRESVADAETRLRASSGKPAPQQEPQDQSQFTEELERELRQTPDVQRDIPDISQVRGRIGGGGGGPPDDGGDDDPDGNPDEPPFDQDDFFNYQRDRQRDMERGFEIDRQRELADKQQKLADARKQRKERKGKGGNNYNKKGNPSSWLRPMFKNVFEQVRKLDLMHSKEWEDLERKTAYDIFHIPRGCGEGTYESENYMSTPNNLCEADTKVRYNMSLNEPMWSSNKKMFGEKLDLYTQPEDYAPGEFELRGLPRSKEGTTRKEAYKNGVAKLFFRKGYVGKKHLQERTGLSIEPEPLSRNITMADVRPDIEPEKDPIDRTQFDYTRLYERDKYRKVCYDEDLGYATERSKKRYKKPKKQGLANRIFIKKLNRKRSIYNYK